MGRPLPGYSVVLVDPASDEVAAEGEICLDLARRPLGLMTAYRDSAERTAEVMRGGRYHTGDVARLDADGSLTYVGRTDDVFKASDYRISPFELESVLVEHEAVVEAAVVGHPDERWGEVPVGYVVVAPGATATSAELIEHCRGQLAKFKVPKDVVFIDALPRNPSGKVLKRELRDRAT
jgi:acetyl-CoA synthetase